MRMIVDKKKSIALIIIMVTIVVIIFGGRYYFAHNKSYKNEAIEKGDCIYLNGVKYYHTSELENYQISNVVICTSDSGRKLYEIEEYPDYEYIAGYSAWDGEIYKNMKQTDWSRLHSLMFIKQWNVYQMKDFFIFMRIPIKTSVPNFDLVDDIICELSYFWLKD